MRNEVWVFVTYIVLILRFSLSKVGACCSLRILRFVTFSRLDTFRMWILYRLDWVLTRALLGEVSFKRDKFLKRGLGGDRVGTGDNILVWSNLWLLRDYKYRLERWGARVEEGLKDLTLPNGEGCDMQKLFDLFYMCMRGELEVSVEAFYSSQSEGVYLEGVVEIFAD
ncbi:hypothetical protein J1N35_037981 [Gossypium stocksii]|uniref:Uncharacterized protein n=1 Tax=Gossypium stocksii TaxID=47602 RepID=A0A9D3UL77_9ROSI|nr:hypothetical protein J1N35_037981 [Gossypium stocksii]